ncbi:hypothetical protein GCM10007298_35400 [Williamsia phyllosphaerae]|uniref:Uncharacterized protein n=1 Tax=Williamsia phyllosphaerae TaxID=885042 RepID=A0ABQ1V500_9NOCA|nr:hypothetical protein GCM10007298_35400 [Williamsia phyllosphaerae]
MTTSTITWTLGVGASLTRMRRRRDTPIESAAARREQARLRRENRRCMQEEAYRVALSQFWARR